MFLFLPMQAAPVSVRALLPQMTDFEYLTRAPNPSFTMAQASSYDRASNPGPHQDWFENNDSGQFVRTETRQGRTEQVMADLKGPGAVVRLWSANPQGTIRFYFDGEEKPRIEENMGDLLDGKVAPINSPFAYEASHGHDMYFPIPYAKSLVITAQDTKGLYYHVGYRTYPSSTPAESFTWGELNADRVQIVGLWKQLASGEVNISGSHELTAAKKVAAGSAIQLPISQDGGEIRILTVHLSPQDDPKKPWTDPARVHNVLRKLLLSISFDGETTVQCPLGDFFSSVPGVHTVTTRPFSVSPNGDFMCSWWMPFRSSASVTITNTNGFTVPLSIRGWVAPRPWTDDSYTFHAQWTGEKSRTRPFHDMHMLVAKGQGYWVGCNLLVGSPSGSWWGEGDEKVFVDGESFPSTFGTGTEDFFGYAWGSPDEFQRPYHAQPYTSGMGNYGYSSDCRFQLFDPIPFTRSLQFDLEQWHWADVVASYDRTAYWYAAPGSSLPPPVDPSLNQLMEIGPLNPVAGALEGEDLHIVKITGGKTQVQQGWYDELSGGKQLWWTDPNVGDQLVLDVPVKKAGRYELILHCCYAADYGIHEIKINGKEMGTLDFFHDGVHWEKKDLGAVDLPRGKAKLEIDCVGANPGAEPRRMFGLDYVLLSRL